MSTIAQKDVKIDASNKVHNLPNTGMRKGLWILAFIVLTFVGDRFGGFLLSKLVEKSQFRYSRLYTGKAKADILLAGNSRGLMFYQPHIEEITGKSTFNVSYNGMPIELGRALIEDYFDKYPAPELLLLDVTMADRLNDGLVTDFNLYSPLSKRLDDIILETSPNTGYGGRVANLYRYNSEVFQRSMNYLNRSDEDWLLDRVINEYMLEDAKNLEPYTITLLDESLEDLKALTKFVQSKGTKIQYIINPYFPDFLNNITNLEDYKQRIEAGTGVKVHNYAGAITDIEAFGDYQHLNKDGAKIFLDMLKRDGILP